MTSSSRTDADQQRLVSSADTNSPLSLLDDRWLPHEQLSVPVDDIGFRQGVVAVERLRTYRRNIFMLQKHLRRWESTLKVLGIRDVPTADHAAELLTAMLERNSSWIEKEGDVGLTMVATPGTSPRSSSQVKSLSQAKLKPQAKSRFMLHLNRLDHSRIIARRQAGQPLYVSSVTQPSPDCWPREIKVRSRIHYYLADNEAQQWQPDAIGVLLDEDGSITEASVCNVAAVIGKHIVSPPSQRVLPGVTQAVVEEIAGDLSIDWKKRPILPDELRGADEILLMGTDTGLWFANEVDGPTGSPRAAGPVYLALRQRFEAKANG